MYQDTGFTSIEVKNYKSFKNLKLNLKKNKRPKHMIAIYGENSSGKSNIVNLFSSLVLSTRTLLNQKRVTNFLSKYSQGKIKKVPVSILRKFIIHQHQSLQGCFPHSYMIGAKGPMEIRYNFQINGQRGYYQLQFDSDLKLLNEQLHFTINKAMGKMFEVKRTNNKNNPYSISLNNQIFSSKLLRRSINDSLIKFWGKHTFLASLTSLFEESNKEFIYNHISPHFRDVYSYFRRISIRSDLYDGVLVGYIRHKSFDLLKNLNWGTIRNTPHNLKIVKCTENSLNDYFLPLYSDIDSLKYHVHSEGHKLRYSLYENKRLDNKIIPIPFSMESSGTQKLLGLFNLILDAINGDTVVIDEIDQDIHDLLMNRLISDIVESIKGQLIFTTHDTYLMTELNRSSLYVIQVDSNDHKRVVPISKATGVHIAPNNNIQKMYLHGFFSGIPYLSDVYFDDILKDIKEAGKKRNK